MSWTNDDMRDHLIISRDKENESTHALVAWMCFSKSINNVECSGEDPFNFDGKSLYLQSQNGIYANTHHRLDKSIIISTSQKNPF